MQINQLFSNAGHIAIIPAAGVGQRFGAALPKQYAVLAGQAMLVHTVRSLLAFSPLDAVCVVVSASDDLAQQCLAPLACPKLHIFYEGGDARAQTVAQALSHLSTLGSNPNAWIWVHDAARPAVPLAALTRLHAALAPGQAAILTVPVADTVKQAAHTEATLCSAGTLDRSTLHLAQTPQVAQLAVLSAALQSASAAQATITDEASALELNGVTVVLVQGSTRNFKVTTQEDAALMQAQLTPLTTVSPAPPTAPWPATPSHPAAARPAFRIGEGMDVHALVLGRPLILGGVTVAHTHGLLGHSDADALCHAVTDALLGAAALGDIGRMFPDTDAQYAGADSTVLLAQAYAAVQAAGYALINLDATIIAQAPKLAAHIPLMQTRLARVLDCAENQLNIKAKTNEKLGFLGRQEGIECRVTVLLERI